MRCSGCHHENQGGSRFCARCGASLEAGCRACGAGLPPGALFCGQCGAEQQAVARTSAAGTPPLAGERRQITAMFCDLAGSTELSQRVDPEKLREILATYQDTATQAITRYDGHVAQYLGDGLLVYFGFPRAHEDDAERAVRAALEIQSALAALNRGRAGAGAEPIEARIGIHTGLVVVTEVGGEARQETLALGETINMAARLQALAEPGGILVSHSTLRLVPGRFVTRDLGTPPLKGVSDPLRVHAVDGVASLGSGFRATGSLTPFTGRERELAQLQGQWQEAREGRGQVVPVSGEAGIGKSRLIYAFQEQLADAPHFTLQLGCSPYASGSAFQPVITLLEQSLGLSDDDSGEAKLKRLEERLGGLEELDLAEVVPYLGVLLSLPESEHHPLTHMGPELQREKTIQALLAPVLALARRQPLLLVCEDLHWSDPSTLEWLGCLIDEAPTLPMLLVLSFRPEFSAPWRSVRSYVSPVELDRLDPDETRRVVGAAAGDPSRLPPEVIDRLVQRADGIPLFAEELARSVLDSSLIEERAAARPAADLVPSTLQDSLMARLDRLSAAKHVAQLGATLGRTFGYTLAQAVADVSEEVLRSGLNQLVEAEILYQSGDAPESTYTFKHALLQDTAYESQLRSRRRELHARTAQVLEERFPHRAETEPALLARHCAEGGLTSQAVEHYRKAGDQAVVRVAYPEANGYFERALELLATLPEDKERHSREIELRLAQGSPLAAMRGFEDAEVMRSIERTELLCRELDPGPQQIPALLGLTLFNVNRSLLPRAREYAIELLSVVEPLGLAPLCVAGYMIKGTGGLTSATVPEACADLKQAIDIAETTELQKPTKAFDIDGKAMAHAVYAMGLVMCGRIESAIASIEKGIERGRALGHPRTLASVLQDGGTAYHLMDDPANTVKYVDQCRELIAGRGFNSLDVCARILGGWGRARMGEPQGFAEMDEGFQRGRTYGILGGMTQFHFAAAELYSMSGQFDRAFQELAEGEALIEQTGEHVGYAPMAVTMRARIMLEAQSAPLEEIQALLDRSLEMWVRNQAPWFQIHTATLLARVALRSGNRVPETRERLQAIYDGFDEGHATERLRTARSLLEELSAT